MALPSPFEKRTAEPPAARTSFPPSPWRSSMLEILVPSGIFFSGRMFPFETAASRPCWTSFPTARPETAGM